MHARADAGAASVLGVSAARHGCDPRQITNAGHQARRSRCMGRRNYARQDEHTECNACWLRACCSCRAGRRVWNYCVASSFAKKLVCCLSGEAEATLAVAQATARAISFLSESIKANGGVEAASLRIAEQYIQAFSNIAKEGTTLLLPSSAANPASMMAQALTIYKSLVGGASATTGPQQVTQSGPLDGKNGDESAPESKSESPAAHPAVARTPSLPVEPMFSLQTPRNKS
ncbi:hypothetical protein ACLOJK_032148 [Asimina triloba]